MSHAALAMVAAGDGAAQDAGVAAAGGGAAGSGFLAECADTLAARARMKVAVDRQAESERMVREAAEAAAAAKAAAAAAGPVAGDDDGAAAGGEAGEGGAGPKKRKPKSAGAPKSRSELPTSGYHGVVKKSPNCFQCKTLVNGKVLFIGSFNTAESAARAYDVCMRDLTQRSGDKREPSYNFVSDAVAEKAAELAEAAVQQEGGSKMCGQCGEQMAVRLKVCRKCRQGSGTRSLFKGVRAKSGTAAVPPLGGPVVAAAGGDPDGEAPAPAAPVAAAKYQAFVWHDRTNEYIGTYHTEEEAALAYDMRYREVFGDGADVSKLNWPTIAEGQAAVDAALRKTAAPRPAIVQKRRKNKGEEGGEEGAAPRPKKRRPSKAAAGAGGAAGAAPASVDVAMFEGASAAVIAAATAALVPLCDVPAARLPPSQPRIEALPPPQPVNIFAQLGI